MTFFLRTNYVWPSLYSGLLVMKPQVKRRSITCSSFRPQWMSFVAHSQVSDAIFAPIFDWNNLLFRLSDLRFKLSPGFQNWSKISKRLMYKLALCFKMLLKIPPFWSQLGWLVLPIKNESFSCLSNQDQVILLGAITKIKRKCPLSRPISIQ